MPKLSAEKRAESCSRKCEFPGCKSLGQKRKEGTRRRLCTKHHKMKYGMDWRGRRTKLRRQYGMSLQDYDSLLQSQEGVCGICKRNVRPRRGDIVYHMAVDHDHRTGKVRGILCYWCNTRIGLVREDVGWMASATKYLERHRSVEPQEGGAAFRP